jgi:hypothetical protein
LKDTLNRLARGEFQTALPTLGLSVEGIAENICAGDLREWELNITSDRASLKGLVYSDNPRVVPEEDGFGGSQVVLHYKVDAAGLLPGDVLEGHFSFVTNGGSRQVPYCFKVVNKVVDSSIGAIHNLFHFANLVQVSEDEACRVFLRDDFESIFIKNDLETGAVYRNLKGGSDVRQAMEEFLIAVRKKQPVAISVKGKESIRHYDAMGEDYHDVIVLEKNTWGYARLKASCDADFIRLDKNEFTTDDFLGNSFELGFLIVHERLHAGNNYAGITISTGSGEVLWQLEVTHCGREPEAELRDSLLKKKSAVDITMAYIAYRTGRMSFGEWAEMMGRAIDDALAHSGDVRPYRLMQAQLYCMLDRRAQAGEIIDQVRDLVLDDEHSLLYPYYLYVSTLYERNQEYTAKAAAIMHRMYERGERSWQLLWMLFYVDGSYDRNKSLKLARIKELFHGGCHSPVMYLEACEIINEQPVLLRVFDEFERQVINFGCRHDIIHERLAAQICEMGAREKNVSRTYLRGLKALYDRFGTDQILTVLCEHMIRGQMTGPEFFPVYELGVLRGLRITRLFECYMDSLVPYYEGPLPKLLLMYFSHENQLTDSQKAYLYVNVIQNFREDDPIRRSYLPQMEQFAIAQLQMGNISDNLVCIYKEMWDGSLIRKETALPVARLLFAYKLTCQCDGIDNVIVTHKELASETVAPVIDRVAYISMYTEGCSIAFEDSQGHRMANVHYELERLMEMPECVETVYELLPDDIYLSVYYYERSRKYKMCTVDEPYFWERLLNRMEISEMFARELVEVLVEHYHARSIDGSFSDELGMLLRRNVTARQSARLLEACIVHGLEREAQDIALGHGTMFVGGRKLYKLCRYLLDASGDEISGFLVKLCHDVFTLGQYDEAILGCLQMNFNGTTGEMLDIWEKCQGFEVNCYELSERLVGQIMFTGERNKALPRLFAYYYEEGAKERVVEAYLSNEAYMGFIRHADNDTNIYHIIESRLEYGEDVTDLCKLALLEDYSLRTGMDERTLNRARLLLTYFANKDMLFAFFGRFAAMGILPLKAMDKTVIEYRGNPGDRVVLHYLVGDSHEEFVEEPMKDVFMGIFTRTFTLFHGESIQYYITVEANGNVAKGEMETVGCSEDADKVGGRYGCLNDMLMSRDAHDIGNLNRLMKSYCVEDYMTRQLFKVR